MLVFDELHKYPKWKNWLKGIYDVTREDHDLKPIRNIQLLALFLDALRHRVRGMITISNLTHEIEVSPKTGKAWLELLERMYLVLAI